MANFTGDNQQSGDLFGDKSVPRRAPLGTPRLAPGLTAARVLCRQLRRKKSRPEKQRIAHLICLNLLSMLRQDAVKQGKSDAI